MTATRGIDLNINITGNGLQALEELEASLASNAVAADNADASVDALTNSVEANTDALVKQLSTRQELEDALKGAVSVEDALAKASKVLTKRIAENGEAFLEAGEKVFDAQRKLAEYGADARQQTVALNKINRAVKEFGVAGTEAAIVMEELATELQDPAKALKVYDAALASVAKSHRRTEDAVSDFTDALKGDTTILRQYGKAGSRVADAIDEIADPAERSRLIFQNLGQVQARASGPIGKLSNGFANLSSQLALIGPEITLVVGALAAAAAPIAIAAGAFVALGVAVKDFAIDSFKTFTQESKEVKVAIEVVDEAAKGLKVEFAELALGGEGASKRLAFAFQTVADKIDEITVRLRSASPQLKGFFDSILRGSFSAARGLVTLAKIVIRGVIVPLEKEFTRVSLIVNDIERQVVKVQLATAKLRGVGGQDLEELAALYKSLNLENERLATTLVALERGRTDIGLGGAVAQAEKEVNGLLESLEAILNGETTVGPLRDSKKEEERRKKALAKLLDDEEKAAEMRLRLIDKELSKEEERRFRARQKDLQGRYALIDKALKREKDGIRAIEEAIKAREERLASQPLSVRLKVEPEAEGIGGDLFGGRVGAAGTDQGDSTAGGLFGSDPAKALREIDEEADAVDKALKKAGLTAEAVGATIATSMAGAAAAFGRAAVEGENLAVALGSSLIGALGGALVTMGTQLSAAGAGLILSGFPGAGGRMAAGGLAVAAAGGVLQAFAGQIGGGSSSRAGGGGGGGGSVRASTPTRAGAASGGGSAGAGPTLAAGSEGPEEMTIVAQFGDDATGRVVGRATRRNRRQRATL